MTEGLGKEADFTAVLLEKKGKFYFYQPGLGLIASGSTISEAHQKFAAGRATLFEEAKNAELVIGHPVASMATLSSAQSTVAITEKGVFRELGMFAAKFCLVLLVLGGIGGAGVAGLTHLVGKLGEGAKPLSLDDIARKAEEVARDVRNTPEDSKEMLRRSIAALSRAVEPLVDAWRKPDGLPDPVRPAQQLPD